MAAAGVVAVLLPTVTLSLRSNAWGHPAVLREAGVELALASRRGLSVKGSPGAGQWAAVPWISVFDDIVTDSATHGYYVVYLFHSYPPARCTQSSAVRAPEVGEHICRKYFIEIRTIELENVQIRH